MHLGDRTGARIAQQRPAADRVPADSMMRNLANWPAMTSVSDVSRARLLRHGFALEYATLCWNVVGVVVLTVSAIAARSVALAGFGLDSLIEIGASTVVIWELSGTGEARQRRGLRLIAYAFVALAAY